MIEEIQVSVSPDALRAGSDAIIEAKLVGDASAASCVGAAVVGYDIYERLTPVGEGTYRLQTTVPWEASPGTYHLSVYAVGSDGSRLKEVTIPVTIG